MCSHGVWSMAMMLDIEYACVDMRGSMTCQSRGSVLNGRRRGDMAIKEK